MFGISRYQMTVVAAAAMVILLFGCHERGVPTGKNKGHGHLLFQLYDTVAIAIPGQWLGDTLLLQNDREVLTLAPSDSSANVWHIPVFDGTIALANDTGHWRDNLRQGDYRVPVHWRSKDTLPKEPIWPKDTLSWLLTFGEDNPWFGQLYMQKEKGLCRGTIATSTGDFRYLHGSINRLGEFSLQTFDGAHLFLFKAKVSRDGDIVDGVFHSGNHFSTSFFGTRISPSEFGLVDSPKAQWTGLPVAYSGVSLEGDSVHWGREGAKGVHVLSVMGSWCPNCMDEHRLLLKLSENQPNLTIHTLAFERGLDTKKGKEEALRRLSQYAQHMGLNLKTPNWRVTLIGPASKTEAQKALPFLDRVVSFPTTIVLGEGLEEPWIHSGFNGPATGPAHDLEASQFASAISGRSENH